MPILRFLSFDAGECVITVSLTDWQLLQHFKDDFRYTQKNLPQCKILIAATYFLENVHSLFAIRVATLAVMAWFKVFIINIYSFFYHLSLLSRLSMNHLLILICH